MMIRRVVLGAVLGGIAMFVWGGLSHMVLGFTDRTLKTFADDTEVVGPLSLQVPDPGIYIFPGLPENYRKLGKDEQAAVMKRMDEFERTRPHGILVISNPTGESVLSPKQLGKQ